MLVHSKQYTTLANNDMQLYRGWFKNMNGVYNGVYRGQPTSDITLNNPTQIATLFEKIIKTIQDATQYTVSPADYTREDIVKSMQGANDQRLEEYEHIKIGNVGITSIPEEKWRPSFYEKMKSGGAKKAYHIRSHISITYTVTVVNSPLHDPRLRTIYDIELLDKEGKFTTLGKLKDFITQIKGAEIIENLLNRNDKPLIVNKRTYEIRNIKLREKLRNNSPLLEQQSNPAPTQLNKEREELIRNTPLFRPAPKKKKSFLKRMFSFFKPQKF